MAKPKPVEKKSDNSSEEDDDDNFDVDKYFSATKPGAAKEAASKSKSLPPSKKSSSSELVPEEDAEEMRPRSRTSSFGRLLTAGLKRSVSLRHHFCLLPWQLSDKDEADRTIA